VTVSDFPIPSIFTLLYINKEKPPSMAATSYALRHSQIAGDFMEVMPFLAAASYAEVL
jgi:hypothetical protein